MKKLLALILSTLLLCSVLSPQVFAREIKDFQFLPHKTLYYQGVGGHFDEENPDRFIFDICFIPGDIIRLMDFANLDTDYTCVRNPQTGELEFVAENGDVIATDELQIYTAQEDGDDWRFMDGEENLHSYYVVLEGNEAEVQIRIARNPVSYICYYPNGEQRHPFEQDGEWRTDGTGNPYFHYALQFVKEGDGLCVGTNEGYECYYNAVWSEEQQQFYFEPTEEGVEPLFIGSDGIEFEDNQAEQHFTVGADNYYTVRYMGKSYEIQVVIDAAGNSSILGAVNTEEIHHALTVSLYEGETQVQQQELSSSEFRFDNLTSGTYTIKITGVCLLPVTLTGLTVTDNSVLSLPDSDNEQLRVITIAEGDVNGDNCIDIGDVSTILTEGVYGSAVGENASLAANDVNADGVIDIGDISVLLQKGNYGAGAKTLAY